MNKKNFLSLVSLLSVINGAAYLFFTRFSLSFLGVNASDFGFMITRYYGACALGYGILLWFSRGESSNVSSRAILLSILVVLIPSAIVGFMATLNGTYNEFGWLFVCVDTSLSIGAIYFLINKVRKKI